MCLQNWNTTLDESLCPRLSVRQWAFSSKVFSNNCGRDAALRNGCKDFSIAQVVCTFRRLVGVSNDSDIVDDYVFQILERSLTTQASQRY